MVGPNEQIFGYVQLMRLKMVKLKKGYHFENKSLYYKVWIAKVVEAFVFQSRNPSLNLAYTKFFSCVSRSCAKSPFPHHHMMLHVIINVPFRLSALNDCAASVLSALAYLVGEFLCQLQSLNFFCLFLKFLVLLLQFSKHLISIWFPAILF